MARREILDSKKIKKIVGAELKRFGKKLIKYGDSIRIKKAKPYKRPKK